MQFTFTTSVAVEKISQPVLLQLLHTGVLALENRFTEFHTVSQAKALIFHDVHYILHGAVCNDTVHTVSRI